MSSICENTLSLCIGAGLLEASAKIGLDKIRDLLGELL